LTKEWSFVAKKAYFLAKTDPSEYSLADLEREGETIWTGVKNPAALQAIRAMRKGDCVLIYHSQGESAIVGWASVSADPEPDPQDPKLAVVRLRWAGNLREPLELAAVKATSLFNDIALVRQGRLSTMALPDEFVRWLKSQRKEFKG
jgi:predicted RNA-binding protein with PUA-like domain